MKSVKKAPLPSTRQERLEERIAEVRYRLAVEGACGGGIGALEKEEELLGEAADLERLLRLLRGEEPRGA